MSKRTWIIIGSVIIGIILIVILLVLVFVPSPPPIFRFSPCDDPPLITKVVSVEATEFVFRPSSIQAEPCQKVRLIFRNVGNEPHTFKIDGIIDSGKVHPGVTRTLEFIAPEREGQYPFYNSISNYRQLGMEGVLVVE